MGCADSEVPIAEAGDLMLEITIKHEGNTYTKQRRLV